MDSEAINGIINDANIDYDLTDSDDVTQLIIDLLYTYEKDELVIAKATIINFLEK